jgi:hypothetical protein
MVSLALLSLRDDPPTSDAGARSDPAAQQILAEARVRAQDKGAQSDLRNALVAAKTMRIDAGTYADASTTALASIEPSLSYVEGEIISSPSTISAFAVDDEWAAARMSESGTCFWIKDSASTGTTYGSGLPCTGHAAMKAVGAGW